MFSTRTSASPISRLEVGTLLVGGDIKLDASLAAIEGQEAGALLAEEHGALLAVDVTPPQPLDLEDGGAEIRQHLGAVRARDIRGQIEHTHARERPLARIRQRLSSVCAGGHVTTASASSGRERN